MKITFRLPHFLFFVRLRPAGCIYTDLGASGL
jgi:hypothetical protein